MKGDPEIRRMLNSTGSGKCLACDAPAGVHCEPCTRAREPLVVAAPSPVAETVDTSTAAVWMLSTEAFLRSADVDLADASICSLLMRCEKMIEALAAERDAAVARASELSLYRTIVSAWLAGKGLIPELDEHMGTLPERDRPALAACADCGLPYEDDGFVDLVVPDDAWAKISPTGHEGGLLCPTCLVRRALRAGLRCTATFRSGPFVGERGLEADAVGRLVTVARLVSDLRAGRISGPSAFPFDAGIQWRKIGDALDALPPGILDQTSGR